MTEEGAPGEADGLPGPRDGSRQVAHPAGFEDRLSRLTRLHEVGVLSDEEFAAARSRLARR